MFFRSSFVLLSTLNYLGTDDQDTPRCEGPELHSQAGIHVQGRGRTRTGGHQGRLPSILRRVDSSISSSGVLDHREDVARRIGEPGDRRTARIARDAALICLESRVTLDLDPSGDELVDCGVDVGDSEVQDRVGGRDEIGLGLRGVK